MTHNPTDPTENEPPDGQRSTPADGGDPNEMRRDPSDVSTDGGTAAGADDVVLDPWGSSTIADYAELFEEFGIEPFDEVLREVPTPHFLMRRGIIFGHRDYRALVEAMRDGESVAALSGFMPTGDPHIGHKMVFDELVWHQQQGADTYGLIADLEAHAARGLSWNEIDEHARNYLLSLLAVGFDPEAGELYRQSDNRAVQDLAFELGIEANFSEMQAIYGFDRDADVAHLQSVLTQAADILYPQLDEPTPTVIPVGPDQDPHLRLTRDLAARTRYFGVTEAYASFELEPDERVIVAEIYQPLQELAGEEHTPRCIDAAVYLEEGAVDFDDRPDVPDEAGNEAESVTETKGSATPGDAEARLLEKLKNAGKEPLEPRTRFIVRKAPDAAFEALVEAIEGEKRVYEAHVDAFELDRAEAEALAREIELDHGGYGFYQPSSIYHRFMTGLTGGKMSSSVPASHISLLDDPETGYEKVKAATTGGRETAELHRQLGGEADKCPVYELYAYLLCGDDDEYATRVYDECTSGERLCGDCKEEAAVLMRQFLRDHQAKREELAPVLEGLDIELDSPRKR